MISFDTFIPEDGIPIYMQIIRHIKQGIIAGTVSDQDEVPSRRLLSSLLGVNPNTIQKAYRLLEEEGIMESRTGAKSYITLDKAQAAAIRAELTASEAASLTRSMRRMGLSLEEVLALIEKSWSQEEEWE